MTPTKLRGIIHLLQGYFEEHGNLPVVSDDTGEYTKVNIGLIMESPTSTKAKCEYINVTDEEVDL